jgi:hypothetical protein
VTKAVNEPRKFVLAAMDFLRTHAGVFGCFAVDEANSYRVWRSGESLNPH